MEKKTKTESCPRCSRHLITSAQEYCVGIAGGAEGYELVGSPDSKKECNSYRPRKRRKNAPSGILPLPGTAPMGGPVRPGAHI